MIDIPAIFTSICNFLLNCLSFLLSPIFDFFRSIDPFTSIIDSYLEETSRFLSSPSGEPVCIAVSILNDYLSLSFAIELFFAAAALYLTAKGFMFLWHTVLAKFFGNVWSKINGGY